MRSCSIIKFKINTSIWKVRTYTCSPVVIAHVKRLAQPFPPISSFHSVGLNTKSRLPARSNWRKCHYAIRSLQTQNILSIITSAHVVGFRCQPVLIKVKPQRYGGRAEELFTLASISPVLSIEDFGICQMHNMTLGNLSRADVLETVDVDVWVDLGYVLDERRCRSMQSVWSRHEFTIINSSSTSNAKLVVSTLLLHFFLMNFNCFQRYHFNS